MISIIPITQTQKSFDGVFFNSANRRKLLKMLKKTLKLSTQQQTEKAEKKLRSRQFEKLAGLAMKLKEYYDTEFGRIHAGSSAQI
jgi:glycogen synthase